MYLRSRWDLAIASMPALCLAVQLRTPKGAGAVVTSSAAAGLLRLTPLDSNGSILLSAEEDVTLTGGYFQHAFTF